MSAGCHVVMGGCCYHLTQDGSLGLSAQEVAAELLQAYTVSPYQTVVDSGANVVVARWEQPLQLRAWCSFLLLLLLLWKRLRLLFLGTHRGFWQAELPAVAADALLLHVGAGFMCNSQLGGLEGIHFMGVHPSLKLDAGIVFGSLRGSVPPCLRHVARRARERQDATPRRSDPRCAFSVAWLLLHTQRSLRKYARSVELPAPVL
jgi:hypothetical protein